jgi:DNA-binding LacI/PurR family transcriptional regulator/AraC-like DNA-binding protein/signal transduction histidine kinase
MKRRFPLSLKETRKIGLILASIHTGASNDLWSDFAHIASQSESSLFVFPGGRLASPNDFEYLRNTLFDLANPKNIDGLISWGSSLGGSVSIEEVKDFHKKFNGFPCVTIGMKREGLPGITFDAYTGVMHELIHCIQVHKATRIAFIRGPENHLSANDRFRAYLDALKVCNLPFDPSLVSDPFGWTDGSKALEQLVSERKLIPGKDFDTLCCASDLMMFDAGKILENRGVVIPKDLRVLGFNNSSESHLLKVPCTTVTMPIKQMALLSWSMVEEMLDKGTVTGPDILLPSESIIRRSCGCEDSLGGVENAKKLFTSKDAYLQWISNTFKISETLMQQDILPLLELADHFTQEDMLLSEKIKQRMGNLSYRFLDAGGDPSRISETLTWFELFFANDAFKQNLSTQIRDVILRERDLVSNEHAYALSVQKKKLNSLEYDLLCVRSLSSLPGVLEKHLPQLGIGQCYLVMYQDEEKSIFVGGYDENQAFWENEAFDKELLLPPPLFKSLKRGIFVMEPLFMENQALGYLVLQTTTFDGSLMEELRTALSSTIKGTFLLESANKAKEQAEQAQQSRSEFFVNVSDSLRNPLDTILQLFASLKAKALTDSEVKKSIDSIEDQIDKANHLLDLTLSQTGALGLDFQIFDCSTLVKEFLVDGKTLYEGNLDLPAVYADRKRLFQVFSIIKERILSDGGICTATTEIGKEGLQISLGSSFEGWKSELYKQDPGFSLAERIVLMTGGAFTYQGNTVCLRLPWPTMGGSPSVLDLPSFAISYYITEDKTCLLPANLRTLGAIENCNASDIGRKGLIPSPMHSIVWDARQENLESQLALHVLRRDPVASALPFICLGCPEGYETIGSALESLGLMHEGGNLYVLGDLPSGLSSLVSPDLLVRVSSFGEFKEIAGKKLPSLLITDTCDMELFDRIRKGSVASTVPIVIVKETWHEREVESLYHIPNILIANTSVADSQEFYSRLMELFCGGDLLPPLTGVLVKRAVVFLSGHATSQISRWQLAEAVNVSEDYLTRIFKKETGLSPWDYLNRQRIYIATNLLRQSGLTINEVASQTGFQDQAYFCRVFKKIKGFSPGTVRTKK